MNGLRHSIVRLSSSTREVQRTVQHHKEPAIKPAAEVLLESVSQQTNSAMQNTAIKFSSIRLWLSLTEFTTESMQISTSKKTRNRQGPLQLAVQQLEANVICNFYFQLISSVQLHQQICARGCESLMRSVRRSC